MQTDQTIEQEVVAAQPTPAVATKAKAKAKKPTKAKKAPKLTKANTKSKKASPRRRVADEAGDDEDGGDERQVGVVPAKYKAAYRERGGTCGTPLAEKLRSHLRGADGKLDVAHMKRFMKAQRHRWMADAKHRPAEDASQLEAARHGSQGREDRLGEVSPTRPERFAAR